jgi:hypothetical protein
MRCSDHALLTDVGGVYSAQGSLDEDLEVYVVVQVVIGGHLPGDLHASIVHVVKALELTGLKFLVESLLDFVLGGLDQVREMVVRILLRIEVVCFEQGVYYALSG